MVYHFKNDKGYGKSENLFELYHFVLEMHCSRYELHLICAKASVTLTFMYICTEPKRQAVKFL